MQHFNYSLSHHRFKYLLSFQVISPIPLLLPNMLLISNNVRLLWHTICKVLLEKGFSIQEKRKHYVCVNLQKFTDWVSSCFKMLLESWCNNMCRERKTGISARTGVSCRAVSLCFTLSHYLLCSSALLSHRAFLCSFMVPVLVLFPSLVQEGCSCRILSMLCWERQCMGSTGSVGDFSSSQVWRLQFVTMCLSAFK